MNCFVRSFLNQYTSLLVKKILPSICLTIALCACNSQNDTSSSEIDISTLEWQTSQTGTGPSGEPLTTVALVNKTTNETLAKSGCKGIIAPLPQEDSNLETSHLSIRCWWAGGGYDFDVVTEGNAIQPIRRWVDEESGEGPWENIPLQ